AGVALLLTPAATPAHGAWSLGLLIALCGLTAASIVWSVQPDNSWQDAGRMFAFGAVFGAAIALARAAPARWPAVLGGVILAAARGVGRVLWCCLVPLRLRGAAGLLSGAAGAAGVVAFAFTRHALASDNVALDIRTSAGHQLGALVAAMLLLLTIAGLAIGFFGGRRPHPPAIRRRAGA